MQVDSYAEALLGGAAALAIFTSGSAHAQASTEGGIADDDAIVVTAQRREERLQDVPIAITALGNGTLDRANAKSIEDVTRFVPGLVLVGGQGSQSSSTPVIRGIASFVGAATVGVYIDDTPVQVRPSFAGGNIDLQLFDVERIEVLKGPQGTLYGASSMGGTIRYISPEPNFGRWDARVRTELSTVSHGDPNAELAFAAGGPIERDRLAVRLSASVRREGGYIDRISRTTGAVVAEDVNSNSTLTIRAAAEWRPTDTLSISPAVLVQRFERRDFSYFEVGLGRLRQRAASPQPGRDLFYLPSITAKLDLPFGTLTSITSALRRNSRQNIDSSTLLADLLFGQPVLASFPNYDSVFYNRLRQRVIAQEIRLASDASNRLRWIAGLFFTRSRQTGLQFATDGTVEVAAPAIYGITAEQLFGTPLLPGNGVYNYRTPETEKQVAGFADLTLDVAPRFTLSAGARVSRSTLDYESFAEGPVNGGVSRVTGRQRQTPITPKFNVSFRPKDDVLLFATAQRGFRTGGVNLRVPQDFCAADIRAVGGREPPATYRSDTIWSYEAGLKSQVLNRAVTVNLSVYRIDWNEIQQTISLPGCGFLYVDNLGKARSRGLELEMSARPARGLQLAANLALTDAEFRKDVLTAPDPSSGERVVITRAGDKVLGVPDFTVALSGDYRWRASSSAEPYVHGDFQHVGRSFLTLPQGRAGFNPATFRAESYSLGTIRAGVVFSERTDLSVFVYNVADERPVIGGSTFLAPVSQIVRASTLRPRTIGVTLNQNF
jgi:iron complex outermembrane recepter protein